MSPRKDPTAPVGPATYSRPVEGKLFVILDNGEQWEATAADLDAFRLVDAHVAYSRFSRALYDALEHADLMVHRGNDLTNAELNPIRYLAEIAIVNPHLLDHPEHEHWSSIAELERRLRDEEIARNPERVP